jgi:peptidoglycan/xylan/chitin deacetylase (PgdA/CDA1 family)
VWSLSKLARYIINGENIPPKTVALTIDDAYITIYTEAYPRLKKYNFPFTVFVNTTPVDNKSRNYMTWNQMREMSSFGAEFANHSMTHDVLLPRNSETEEEWQKRLKNEIEGAQRRMQEELGSNNNENPKLFSYPFGEYSMQTADFIQSLGYIGIAQTSGPIGVKSDTRFLPRFAMSEAYAEMDGFSLKIQTLPFPVESVSPLEPLTASKNPPVLSVKLKYPVEKIRCYLSSGEELSLERISQTQIRIQAKNALRGPRERYTCTAPSQDGKWYWYSHLWIIK